MQEDSILLMIHGSKGTSHDLTPCAPNLSQKRENPKKFEEDLNTRSKFSYIVYRYF